MHILRRVELYCVCGGNIERRGVSFFRCWWSVSISRVETGEAGMCVVCMWPVLAFYRSQHFRSFVCLRVYTSMYKHLDCTDT